MQARQYFDSAPQTAAEATRLEMVDRAEPATSVAIVQPREFSEPKLNSVPDWTVDEILDAAGELAALPHVVLSLIQMTSDPSVTAVDLEKVILTDQAVAARVLALANSAYFGLPRKVFFVREAVVFLGFKTVRNLAMTVNAINMFFGKSDKLSVARAQLWHHSLNVALVSRFVADYLHRSKGITISPEEAFTAGLLHDIGKMVLDIAMPQRYMMAIKLIDERGVRLHEIEDKLFPYSHSTIGSRLAARWDLPVGLCDAMEHHHDPQNGSENRDLIAVVALANELSHYCADIDETSEQTDEEVTEFHNDGCAMLGIEPAELPSLLLSCQTEIEKGLSLHNIL